MKTLLLLRHAKSSWKNESLPDHDRPLNERGKKAAPQMGRLMKEKGLVPDLVLSSTALRARATAEAAAEAAGCPPSSIVLLEELYLATAGELLEQARAVPDDSVEKALLVAHNPGMEDLVNVLSGRRERFPTAALAVFRLNVARWRTLALGGDAKLVKIWRPREV